MATEKRKDSIRLRKRRWLALDSHVITVATEGWCGDWTAYIGAVPGNCHEEEWEEVLHHGAKLPEKVAEVLFPEFATSFAWRD